MWALPALSPAVPLEVSKRQTGASGLASFMLLAHRMGIHLPTSKFTTTMDAMTRQFAGYATEKLQENQVQLPLVVELNVLDGFIRMAAHAVGSLDCYYLKPVVERLNQKMAGLGWFVASKVAESHRIGLSTYDPGRIVSVAQQIWGLADSDEEMAAEMHQIDVDEVTADQLEGLADECRVLPSAVLNEFGGHKNLIGFSQSPVEIQATRPMTARNVRAFMKSMNLSHEDSELMNAVLEFDSLISRKKLEAHAAPQGWRSFESEQEEYEEEIGALAFVVWDETDLAFEIVSDYEQYAMSGEGCTTQLAGLKVDLEAPETWKVFITAYKLYIARYAAFSKFIGRLPKKENLC